MIVDRSCGVNSGINLMIVSVKVFNIDAPGVEPLVMVWSCLELKRNHPFKAKGASKDSHRKVATTQKTTLSDTLPLFSDSL
jgi:hypothetical protein